MHTEILIVGGGLAGLSLAQKLQSSGRHFLLVEARDRFGGRIKVAEVGAEKPEYVDLGPAWFWYGQPRIARLAASLNIEVFEQYSKGNMVLHEADGSVRRDLAFSTMAGSLRLTGGMASLIDGLANALPTARLHRNHTVKSVTKGNEGLSVEVLADDKIKTITCEKIIFALPPRLVGASISFAPALSQIQALAMRSVPTWMAGHAKVLAVYETPFWRDMGLSGDGMSRRGPMVEIHDASPQSASIGALFGFVGVPTEQALGEAALEQLTAMFGETAANPVHLIVQDWASESFTATSDDFRGPDHHPAYGMPRDLAHIWEGSIIFASTEVGQSYGGFLEGALEAAEAAFGQIERV